MKYFFISLIIVLEINCPLFAQKIEDRMTFDEYNAIYMKYMKDTMKITPTVKGDILTTERIAEFKLYFQKNISPLRSKKDSVIQDAKRQGVNKLFFLEMQNYHKQTATVRNYQDYVNLLNRFPTFKKGEKGDLTEAAFEKQLAHNMILKWRIYRDKAGNLSLYRDDEPVTDYEKKISLERIDNLPRE